MNNSMNDNMDDKLANKIEGAVLFIIALAGLVFMVIHWR